VAAEDAAKRRDHTSREAVTPEVGDEGGSAGDVEIHIDRVPGQGSEATETWRPQDDDRDIVHRDQTGEGRRSP
jgi:hypothetical protein